MQHPPIVTMRALQYLYYTGDGLNRLGGSPVSDKNYDLFCERFGLAGSGGSDLEKTYSPQEIALAEHISKYGAVLDA